MYLNRVALLILEAVPFISGLGIFGIVVYRAEVHKGNYGNDCWSVLIFGCLALVRFSIGVKRGTYVLVTFPVFRLGVVEAVLQVQDGFPLLVRVRPFVAEEGKDKENGQVRIKGNGRRST